ncbi:hypothetical protein MBLNU457_g3047t1 [Dothideomycetes sp. NU457]
MPFGDENLKHQKSIANVLEKYGQLLSDFKSLQSDYEETKEARERYKKMAKGQDKSPFVLLLVDGDGYYFDESLVKQGADGGIKAATTMQNVMQDRLSRMGFPDETKIIVKIYMNLQGVSQSFHRYGIVGSQARSIAPFTSAFSKIELFDIIDCGEKRECCEAKIKENFDLFVDNASCRHVFFAGCQSTAHLPFIKRYNGRKSHITLIKAAKHATEFDNLEYNVEELPGVFRKAKPDDYLLSQASPPTPSETAPWKARPSRESRDLGSIDEQRDSGRRGPGCRLHWTMHQIDPKVVDWVPAQVAEPTDIKPIPNNEEDLLIESLEDDMDAPEIPPSTKNFELTSAWAQSVLSPTPSQLPTPTATVLESAVERETTLAEEKSRRWHEAAGRDRETNIEEMHEHFQPAARAKRPESRPTGDAWNTAQDHDDSAEEPQTAPQEQQSPSMLMSSRWNSVDESSSRSAHPAAQAAGAAGWGNHTDSYNHPEKDYPSPPTSNSPAPSKSAKEDRSSNGRFSATPAPSASRSAMKPDARAWKPPRGPVSDSYIESTSNGWGESAPAQISTGWPAPVREDDGPYGW